MTIHAGIVHTLSSAIEDLETYRRVHAAPAASDSLATITAALESARRDLLHLRLDVLNLGARLGQALNPPRPTPYPKGPTPP